MTTAPSNQTNISSYDVVTLNSRGTALANLGDYRSFTIL
jgi:hypothetical protein